MKKISALILLFAVILALFCSCKSQVPVSEPEGQDSMVDMDDKVVENIGGEWVDSTGKYSVFFDGVNLKISENGSTLSRSKVKAVRNTQLESESVFIVERETGGFLSPFTEFRIMDNGTLTAAVAAPNGKTETFTFTKQAEAK